MDNNLKLKKVPFFIHFAILLLSLFAASCKIYNVSSPLNVEQNNQKINASSNAGNTSPQNKDTLPVCENMPGNITNNGYAAAMNGWIYYRNSRDEHRLYRISFDGTKNEQISINRPEYIFVSDGWVYYVDSGDKRVLYRYNPGTKEDQKILDDDCTHINIVDDYIFYVDKGAGSIIKIKSDGSQSSRIGNDTSECMVIYDGWIYYTNIGEINAIYRMKMDGSSRQKLSSITTSSIIPYDDRLYFTNPYTLYSINLDGSEQKTIVDGNVAGFNINNGYVFYSNSSDRKLYRIKTDGTERTELCDLLSYRICIAGEHIFAEDSNTYQIVILNLDGTTLKTS